MDGLRLQVLKPCDRCMFQNHWEVEDFGGGVSSCNIDSSRVQTQPLNWILLTIILLVICWFEVFGVLGIGKGAAKGWIAVSVVGEASLTSCVDDLPSINS